MVMMKRIIISIPPHSSILTISIGTKVHMAVLLSTEKKKETEVTQSCPTLCDPMDCSPQAPPSMGFSKQEYWSGLPFPSPGDLPELGTEPGSSAL